METSISEFIVYACIAITMVAVIYLIWKFLGLRSTVAELETEVSRVKATVLDRTEVEDIVRGVTRLSQSPASRASSEVASRASSEVASRASSEMASRASSEVASRASSEVASRASSDSGPSKIPRAPPPSPASGSNAEQERRVSYSGIRRSPKEAAEPLQEAAIAGRVVREATPVLQKREAKKATIEVESSAEADGEVLDIETEEKKLNPARARDGGVDRARDGGVDRARDGGVDRARDDIRPDEDTEKAKKLSMDALRQQMASIVAARSEDASENADNDPRNRPAFASMFFMQPTVASAAKRSTVVLEEMVELDQE